MVRARLKKAVSMTAATVLCIYTVVLASYAVVAEFIKPGPSTTVGALSHRAEAFLYWFPPPLLILGAIVGGFTVAIAASYFVSDWIPWRDIIIARATSKMGWKRLLPILYMAIFLVALALTILFLPSFPDGAVWSFRTLHLLLTRAGNGGASLLFGLFTVFALSLTLLQIHDIRATISSFSELIERVCVLADSATTEDPLYIIAYTPALGYLALPPPFSARYAKAITAKSSSTPPGTKTKMICLERDELKKWHDSFVGKRTHRGLITQHEANLATTEAEEVVETICRPHPEESRHMPADTQAAQGAQAVDTFVYRTSMNKMPGFYVFFTERRAIVVNPLFIPYLLSHNDTVGTRSEMVNMIGYETTDRGVIHDLRTFFEYCTEYCEPERRWVVHQPNVAEQAAE